MRARPSLAAAFAFASLVSGPGRNAAQSPSLPIYEREVFTYPAIERRNPFQPLHLGTQTGPRFEDLTLSGVLYHQGLGSVATLTDRQTGRRYRVREHDMLGEVRVVRIRPEEVDFAITSFGVRREETLRVRREGTKP